MDTSTDSSFGLIYWYPSFFEILVLISILIIAYYMFLKLKQENFLKYSSQQQKNRFIIIVSFVIFSSFLQTYWFLPYWFGMLTFGIFYYFPNFLPIIGFLILIVTYDNFNKENINSSNQKNSILESEFTNRFIRNEVKNCLKCGKELEHGSLFCCNCGNAITVEIRFCSHCGTRLLKNAIFCHECGYNIKNINISKKKVFNYDLEQFRENGNRDENGNENLYCPLCRNNNK